MEQTTNTFTSHSDAVAFVRRELKKKFSFHVSVGVTPQNATERMVAEPRMIFIRNVVSADLAALKQAYLDLNVTLSAGRGAVPYFISNFEF